MNYDHYWFITVIATIKTIIISFVQNKWFESRDWEKTHSLHSKSDEMNLTLQASNSLKWEGGVVLTDVTTWFMYC